MLHPQYKSFFLLKFKRKNTIKIKTSLKILYVFQPYCFILRDICYREVFKSSASLFEKIIFGENDPASTLFARLPDFCEPDCEFYNICMHYPLIHISEFMNHPRKVHFVVQQEAFLKYMNRQKLSNFFVSFYAVFFEKTEAETALILKKISFLLKPNSFLLFDSPERKNLLKSFDLLKQHLRKQIRSLPVANLLKNITDLYQELKDEHILVWTSGGSEKIITFYNKSAATPKLPETKFLKDTNKPTRAVIKGCPLFNKMRVNIRGRINIINESAYYSYTHPNLLLRYKNPYFDSQREYLKSKRISLFTSGDFMRKSNSTCKIANDFYFSLAENMYSTLFRFFGFRHFREGQFEIIDNVLKGFNVFGIMPTGSGKSLTYILPALIMAEEFETLTVIISPLIALMQDQVQNLREKGISNCSLINSSIPYRERKRRIALTLAGSIKILYLSIEQLARKDIQNLLHAIPLNLLVLDEAHCLSLWGTDFRPEYRKAMIHFNNFSFNQVLAVTATATKEIAEDVENMLYKTTGAVFLKYRGTTYRNDIHIEMKKMPALEKKLEYLKKILPLNGDGVVIIYCSFIKTVEMVASELENSIIYHGKLDKFQKNLNFQRFKQETSPVVVCTNAFGMGIDRPDIRLVVHFELPSSIENYYQEIGRAGRDAKGAEALLMYDTETKKRIFSMITSKKIKKQVILEAFRHLYQLNHGKALISKSELSTIFSDDIFSLLETVGAITRADPDESSFLIRRAGTGPETETEKKIIDLSSKYKSGISLHSLSNLLDLKPALAADTVYSMQKNRKIFLDFEIKITIAKNFDDKIKELSDAVEYVQNKLVKEKIHLFTGRFLDIDIIYTALTILKNFKIIDFKRQSYSSFSLILLNNSLSKAELRRRLFEKLNKIVQFIRNQKTFFLSDLIFLLSDEKPLRYLIYLEIIGAITFDKQHTAEKTVYKISTAKNFSNNIRKFYYSAQLSEIRFKEMLNLINFTGDRMRFISNYFENDMPEPKVECYIAEEEDELKKYDGSTIIYAGDSIYSSSISGAISFYHLIWNYLKIKEKNEYAFIYNRKKYLQYALEQSGIVMSLSMLLNDKKNKDVIKVMDTYAKIKERQKLMDTRDIIDWFIKRASADFVDEYLALLSPCVVYNAINEQPLHDLFAKKLEQLLGSGLEI